MCEIIVFYVKYLINIFTLKLKTYAKDKVDYCSRKYKYYHKYLCSLKLNVRYTFMRKKNLLLHNISYKRKRISIFADSFFSNNFLSKDLKRRKDKSSEILIRV